MNANIPVKQSLGNDQTYIHTYIHTYKHIHRSTHSKGDSLNVAVGGEDDEYPGQAPGHQHLSGRAPAAAQGQAGRREDARPDHDAYDDGDAVDHAKLSGPCCRSRGYCHICYDKQNRFS